MFASGYGGSIPLNIGEVLGKYAYKKKEIVRWCIIFKIPYHGIGGSYVYFPMKNYTSPEITQIRRCLLLLYIGLFISLRSQLVKKKIYSIK